jgi:hypothetical protein
VINIGRVALFGLLHLLLVVGASAQENWGRLEMGEQLRVSVTGAGRSEGLVGGRSDGSSLELIAPKASIRVAQIDSVWLRSHSARPGAVIGAAAGAAVFGGFLLGMCGTSRNDCGTSGFGDALPQAAMAALAGAIPGAVVGALVGFLIPRWSLRYTRAAGWGS